jgi:hypothetical protein
MPLLKGGIFFVVIVAATLLVGFISSIPQEPPTAPEDISLTELQKSETEIPQEEVDGKSVPMSSPILKPLSTESSSFMPSEIQNQESFSAVPPSLKTVTTLEPEFPPPEPHTPQLMEIFPQPTEEVSSPPPDLLPLPPTPEFSETPPPPMPPDPAPSLEPTTTYKCIETDDGIDPFLRGWGIGPYTADLLGGLVIGADASKDIGPSDDPTIKPNSFYFDHCVGDLAPNQLNEAYCDGTILTSTSYVCEYGCENGVCLSAPEATVELPELIVGKVSIIGPLGPITGPSSYPKMNELIQFVFTVNNIGTGAVNGIVPGYILEEVWLSADITSGTAPNITLQNEVNECPSDLAPGASCNIRFELIFSETGPQKINIRVNPEYAIQEVNNTNDNSSARVWIDDPTYTCTDSDNGLDIYTRGNATGPWNISEVDGRSVSGGYVYGENPNAFGSPRSDLSLVPNSIYYDYCWDSETSGQLDEALCDGRYVSATAYICPNGCRDGACLPDPEPGAPPTASLLSSSFLASILDSLLEALQTLQNLLQAR